MTTKEIISGKTGFFCRVGTVVFVASLLIWCSHSFWSSDAYWQTVETTGTILVILACAGEYVADFKPFKNLPKDSHRMAKASTLLLIGALAIEVLGMVRTTQISNTEIAQLNESLGNTIKRAAEANERAAVAQQKTAELERESAEERSMRESLAAQTAPRSLSAEQCAFVVEKLKPFAGQRIDVVSFGAGPEGEKFAVQMATFLNEAKWDATAWTVKETDILPPSGVMLMLRPWGETGWRQEELVIRDKSASALAEELSFFGISVTPGYRIDGVGFKEVGIISLGWKVFPITRISIFDGSYSDTPFSETNSAAIRLVVGPRS